MRSHSSLAPRASLRVSPLAATLAATLLAVAIPASAQSAREATIAITGVSVIPMDRERVIADQTVIIQGGRILSIGATRGTRAPADAMVVDGRGKFLMPGLAEMHAHVPPANAPPAVLDRVMKLYVANGITTIRGMLGDASHLPLRERLARGELLGPRLVTSGPSFNNNTAPNPRAGIDSVLSQKRAGYDLLKIHPGVGRETFDSIAATANRVGIPFAGHVPYAVGYDRAITSKYATIDHADGLLEALIRDGAPVRPEQGGFFGVALVDHLDLAKLPALVRRTRDAGVWMVPTAALMENMTDETPPESLAARPEMIYWLPNQVRAWVLNKQNVINQPTLSIEQRRRYVEIRRQALKSLRDGGVKFLLGSDSPQIWNVPGFSTHRELETLVASGFTPYQALETGTRHIAEYLGESSRGGIVAAGRTADLLLLDANPLTDVRNTQKLAGVMVRGRWVPKSELDAMLAALRGS